MTPAPAIKAGLPVCWDGCPHRQGPRCMIEGRRSEIGDVCRPWVRLAVEELDARYRAAPMTVEQAARIAAEDDSVREARRRMGR